MLRENLETSYPNSGQRLWSGFETYFRAGIRVSGFLDDIVGVMLTVLRPFPYHPIGSAKTHGEVADEEGKRLEVLFREYAAGLTGA
jgi:hypothetical protein